MLTKIWPLLCLTARVSCFVGVGDGDKFPLFLGSNAFASKVQSCVTDSGDSVTHLYCGGATDAGFHLPSSSNSAGSKPFVLKVTTSTDSNTVVWYRYLHIRKEITSTQGLLLNNVDNHLIGVFQKENKLTILVVFDTANGNTLHQYILRDSEGNKLRYYIPIDRLEFLSTSPQTILIPFSSYEGDSYFYGVM